jgi:DNA/RNA-binding domain of Phe-tRNA-synthetase-like protein
VFHVTNECIVLGLRATAIEFRDVCVGPATSALRAEILHEAATVCLRFANAAAIRSSIAVKPFHDVLRSAGAHPRRDQNSVERLLTFALKKGDLPAINNLVDAYNLVSLRTGLSLGAHDLDRITLPVTLRLLTGSEAFVPLGSSEPAPVNAGEFGYVDGQKRLLCRLDVMQAEFSKVTETTKNVLLIVEGTTEHTAELLNRTVEEVIAAVIQHCGGTARECRPTEGPCSEWK